MCQAHYFRWYRNGDPGTPHIWDKANEPNPDSGPLSPRWKGDDIAYRSAHRRVAGERGKASDLPCVHCLDQANEWAYDHSEADPLRDPAGSPYSVDVDRYMPMCFGCHRAMDAAVRSCNEQNKHKPD